MLSFGHAGYVTLSTVALLSQIVEPDLPIDEANVTLTKVFTDLLSAASPTRFRVSFPTALRMLT
jgi:hypothetical protein